MRHEHLLFILWLVWRMAHATPHDTRLPLMPSQTDEIHCGNPDPHGLSPCQAGYGHCDIVPPPACSANGGSTNGRTIGYYQASNVRDRLCNKITPGQIDIQNFTHLYYAFATVGETLFERKHSC